MTENNTTNQNYLRDEESTITLAELWGMVWNHKWWYVVSVIIFLILGAFYLYRTPNVYNRSAKVMIDESNQDATMRNLGVASAGMMRLRSRERDGGIFFSGPHAGGCGTPRPSDKICGEADSQGSGTL